jgi:hypothetical protein
MSESTDILKGATQIRELCALYCDLQREHYITAFGESPTSPTSCALALMASMIRSMAVEECLATGKIVVDGRLLGGEDYPVEVNK